MSKKNIYVLDTSVYLTDYRAIFSYGKHDIVVPLIVLEEIDKHKKRVGDVGRNARTTIRILDQFRAKATKKQAHLGDGVRIGRGRGLLYVQIHADASLLPADFDISNPDNKIIATALKLKSDNPETKVVVVSCDINLRIKCDAAGLIAEDYSSNQIVKTKTQIYTGFKDIESESEIIDFFYDGGEIMPEEKLLPNEFVMLYSNSDEKHTALTRFVGKDEPLRKLKKFNNGWVSPKNREQKYAMDLLLDPDVKVVSLIGKAGSGKTLLSLAAGLKQTIGNDNIYNRLLVSRPIQPLGRDLGYLPGTLEEKMTPWLLPIQDNLRFLLGDDRSQLEDYIRRGTIEIEALTYIRGRSVQKAFMIVDEAQNLSRHEIKTILTRIGEGSKVVLTGDVEQIDNVNIDETSNGLAHAVEKLKTYEFSGHVTLSKGERSRVATVASEVL